MGLSDRILKAARGAAAGWSDMSGRARTATYAMGNEEPATIPDETRAAIAGAGMVTGGSFTPGEPLEPYRSVGTPPVLTPFPVGQNLYMMPRSVTGVSFDALSNIAASWDLARLCIEVREDELRRLDWEIVAEDEDDADRYEHEIKAAREFFRRPDGIWDFDTFQQKCAEDWLRYDAMAIYRHRTRGGKLGALEVIDGRTIGPLIDGRGAQPRYPAPAYTQWAWGLPYVWLTERDIIYQPHRPRPETRYGLPPIEWVLMLANTDLRLQLYFLSYFTEGEVPEAFVNAPPDVTDPKQVKALQDAYSAVMSGARASHHKVKWIPPGAKVTLAGKGKFDTDFAQYLNAKGCAAFKVQPAEIGFTENVNKSSGETQMAVQFRRSALPTAKYFQSIWNRILHEDLGMPYARFKYLGIEEEEDQLVLAQTRAIYIQNAVISPDEVRQDLGMEVNPDAPVGRAFATRTGVIFVDAKSQAAARAAGNMAQQAGLEAPPEDPDDEDAEDDDPTLLTPDQTIVDPALKPMPPKPGQAQGGGGTQTAADANKALRDEMRRWRDVALKRHRDGRPQRAFETSIIPRATKASIEAALQKAQTAEEIRSAFPTLGVLRKKGGAQATTETDATAAGVVLNRAQKGRHRTALEDAFGDVLDAESGEIAGAVAKATEKAAKGSPADAAAAAEDALQSYDWQAWGAMLRTAIEEPIRAAYDTAMHEGLATVGGQFGGVNDAAVSYAEKRAAELVGMHKLPDGTFVPSERPGVSITDSTREMLRATVEDAIKNERQYSEIEKALREHYAFSGARAETIARTELGFAYNRGNVAAWSATGTQFVQVFDGEHDPECAAANGAIWTVEEADANPLGHPNCVRSFAPVDTGVQGGE